MTAALRKPGRPKAELVTMAGAFRDALLSMLSESRAISFPAPKYQKDPVGFFEDILGVTPWDEACKVLRALVDHDRVAWKSGRRVAKSHTVAGAALWFWASFEDARVTMTSTTARQVEDILWRELCMMRMKSGRCVRCKAEIDALVAGGLSRVAAEIRIPRPCPHSAIIADEPGVKPSTGLRSDDFRMITGATARQPEAFQGFNGANQLVLADEASGIAQQIFDVISGNRAGGGKVLLTGNPTKNGGEFFDAFGKKSNEQLQGLGYHCVTTSSEDSPNVKAGRIVIPGLATAEYIREREIEWGRESAMFKIHVLGEFALQEEGRIFSVHTIREAEERWHETPESGRLYIGLDPAGASGTGDETMFAVRRGLKLLALLPFRGLTGEGHLAHLLGTIGKYKLPREVPVVVLDREGAIGSELGGLIRAYLEPREKAPPFEFVAVRSSDRAARTPLVYDRMRDELAANLESWFRDGGSIPEDVKLAAELHALEWRTAANGRVKLTAKDDLRKTLGRSPDRYDALALSAWEPLSLREEDAGIKRAAAREDDDDGGPTLDPYAGYKAWR